MPLSEHEQRMLDQLEQQLEAEDPQFVTAMQATGRTWSVARVLGGGVGVLAGLGVLLGGVASNMMWLGIVGFALMLAGAWVAFGAKRAGGVAQPSRTQGPSQSSRSISSKFEERWERRQRGE